MQIVIEIDEKSYSQIKRCADKFLVGELERAVKNGTPLPKGHGRLIDAEELEPKTMKEEAEMMCTNALYIIKSAPTVPAIPLDKVKQAREEMEEKVFDSLDDDGSDWFAAGKVSECMAILDKLIEVGEE